MVVAYMISAEHRAVETVATIDFLRTRRVARMRIIMPEDAATIKLAKRRPLLILVSTNVGLHQ